MPAKNVEEIKAESHSLRGKIADTLQQNDQSHFADEEFQLLKFHGTYQQDDRDQRTSRKQQNLDKAWIFMVRSKLPGGALTAAQYLAHDRIAGELGNGTLRITTRQGFQMASAPDSAFGAIWCAWGYGRSVKLKQVYDTLPAVKKMGGASGEKPDVKDQEQEPS